MPGGDIGIHIARALGSIPWTIVAVAGVILCMINFSRAPRASVLVGIALAIQLFSRFVLPIVANFLFTLVPAQQMDDIHLRILVNSVLFSIPAAVALALLLWAVFSQAKELERLQTSAD